jgi:tetratricopeptide (TPR) repeat protein
MSSETNWLEFFQDRERLHADYYLDFAQQHARRDPEAYNQLEVENGNLLKTTAWLAEQNEAQDILRLAAALWQQTDFLRMRGFLQRGFPLLEQAHRAARQLGDSRLEFIWLGALAEIHLSTGNPVAAQPLFEQALVLAENSDDLLLKARSQLDLGRLLMEMGQLDEGASWLEQALQTYRQSQDYTGEIETLVALGNLLSIQGNATKAVAYIEQGLPLAQAQRDRPGEVALRFALGYVGTATGDWAMAIKHYEPVIEMCRAIGNLYYEVRGLHNIGEAWLELGNIQQAVSCLEEALSLQEGIDDVLTKAFTHFYLGKAYYSLDEWDKSIIQLKQTYPFRDIPIQGALATETAWIMANNYLKLGKNDLARIALHDVLNLAPEYIVKLRRAAGELLMSLEKEEQAYERL